MNAMTIINKAGLKLKKHSPEILVGIGVVGVVVSGVLACKATLKVEEILDEHKENMDKIHECPESEKYTEKDRKHDITIQYAHTAVKLSKLYAPSVGLAIVSLGSILGSNYILRKRNAALAAAYTTVYTAFNEYRERVVDRFGKDVDHQLRYNIKQTEIEETVVDEKGKEKKVKKKIDVAMADESGYLRYLRKGNDIYYGGNNDYVQMALNARQAVANTRLQQKGFVTLNEVYKDLGFQESKAGMVCGWIYDEDHPNGDNYIQFDVKEVWLPNEINGEYEKAFAIDFNVDGNIFEKLTEAMTHK